MNFDAVAQFALFLFEQLGFKVPTIESYLAALKQPLSLAFGIDFDDIKFKHLIKSFWLKRPGTRYVEPKWKLGPVLKLLETREFRHPFVKPQDLLAKCMFLLALAMGPRVSEFSSLLRGKRFVAFSPRMRSVTITPNAAMLAKNECPSNRRSPVTISAFIKRDGTHHDLCPVLALSQYLTLTKKYDNRHFLFLNPETGSRCDKGRIRYVIRKLIRQTQPDAYSRFHDLRKFSCWKAFWAKMSLSDIRNVGYWRSNSALVRSYLQGSVPTEGACIAMGRACS